MFYNKLPKSCSDSTILSLSDICTSHIKESGLMSKKFGWDFKEFGWSHFNDCWAAKPTGNWCGFEAN